MAELSYVLVTAARNEEANIEKTIQSVVSQAMPPRRWVIVSDGSTDRTEAIASSYAKKYPFIQVVRREKKGKRDFCSKVQAVRQGVIELNSIEYDVLGNLDADVSLEPNFYSQILQEFNRNLKLGIAGGMVLEERGGAFRDRFGNTDQSVAGATQTFRRDCYDDIEGYVALEYGGEDTVANETARMKGWDVKAFPHLRVFHHRRTGSAGRSIFRALFQAGMHEYLLGYDPLFEVAKLIRRMRERPYGVGSIVRGVGYGWAALVRRRRPVSPEFVAHLRKEQRNRLKETLRIVRCSARASDI